VLLDGFDVPNATLASLRGQIGIVFQETFVFDTTLRQNIELGRVGATDAEIVAAAKAARLETYIASLPAGYDTVVGEGGVRMSGGQRQRLAIARALLRDPRILILDEATSSLDAQTEREILETLALVEKGRTTISITHRLSLAARADWIFVLDQGQIVEQGTHDQLSGAGGLYQRLCEDQSRHIGDGLGPSRIEAGRLGQIPLFAGVGGPDLEAVAALLVLERYPAGEEVVRQGTAGDRLYIVSSGELEVTLEDGRAERLVNTLGAGDFFGELALLEDRTRTATVRTTTTTDLYSLARARFSHLLQERPDLARAISETLDRRRSAYVFAASAASGG
jgi:ATP-binding cassette subfamily B protein